MGMFGIGDEAKKVGEGIGIVGDALDKLFTSDDERLSHAEMMARLELKGPEIVAQAMVNDSKSNNWFQAGWRPFIGWIAGLGLAIYFIPQYVIAAYMFVENYLRLGTIIDFPASPDALIQLVGALLGLGALRTVEKVLGKAG
jgi:hypothetical protein